MFRIPEDSVEIITRIIIAALLGAMIGLERDIHGRSAGLRTHILVSMGSAVFMVLSEQVAKLGDGLTFTSDPGRIAAQIVTGIGFLGAGVIIKEGINVRGLTTAACLWITAGIGMAAGSGNYIIGGVATLIAVFSLIGLKFVEKIYAKDSYRILSVLTPLNIDTSQIIDVVKRKNIKILNCDIERNYNLETTSTRLSVRLFHKGITDKLAHNIISSLEKADIPLLEVKWEHT